MFSLLRINTYANVCSEIYGIESIEPRTQLDSQINVFKVN